MKVYYFLFHIHKRFHDPTQKPRITNKIPVPRMDNFF